MEDLLFEEFLYYYRQETLQGFEIKFIDPIEIGIAEKFKFETLLADHRSMKTLEITCYY
ncbi:MAG TPA: hypothetical protein VK628_09945 [Flavitalea sp.]|nr:hypothetical protein [Flavitalea sp.]